MFDLSALLSLSLYERIDPNRSMEDNSIKMLWFTGGSFGGRMPLKNEGPTRVGPSALSLRLADEERIQGEAYAEYSGIASTVNPRFRGA